MPLDFSKKRTVNKVEDEGYRRKDRREKQRLLDQTDSEFWLCVCFSSKAGLTSFLRDRGLSGRYFPGDEFREATIPIKPDRQRKVFAHAIRSEPSGEDPLASVRYCGDLEADAKAELLALDHALNSVPQMERYQNVTDSCWWFCVYFRDREDKENYLAEHNLGQFGDKYLDGDAWAARIGR